MQVSVLFLYCKYSGLFEGVCGRSDNESGKPYMAHWQPITSLHLFVYPGRKFLHISTEKSPKLTGTNRFVTNNEKKKELLADNQQIGFLENCVSTKPSDRDCH